MNTDMAIISATFKEAIAWRFSMILSVIIGPIFFSVDILIWRALYATSQQTLIAGLTLEQMMTYLALSLSTLYLLYDDVHERLGAGVIQGTLTTHLLKPIDFWRREFLYKIGHRMLAALIEYLPVVIIIGLFFGFALFHTKNLLFYIMAIIIAFAMSFLINGFLGMIAFWTGRPKNFIRIYHIIQPFLTGAFFPLSLYPAPLQKIVAILPFQFVAYAPSQVFLGSYKLGNISLTPLEVILFGLLQVVILYTILRICWHFSLRRYCGVGQ